MKEGAGMRKKSVLFIAIVIISVALNIYLGTSSFLKSTYTPNIDDQEILGEMTVMTLQNEEYQSIAEKETVHSIMQRVSRFNVADPSSVIHYEVHVSTDQQTYIFYCEDEACTNVSLGGWAYSRYTEEEPLLPLKK
ncbi:MULTISPECIES: hypothetical protein [Sporosarcina]|uniref:hypothetical protein n=1 Tax=Sporosarcina TaxID=1569 RepID=UPI00129A7A38|nr:MULTISPECIES: hypothetical protein [Sporosarcina]GKV63959.1 hypothetical protein NCCP2331_01120 [Sporosarcina sp. NCCP-2331]GLB54740.1 hypothetical protein NCCP2378_05250 [Sporosarcina sp. NCCP-2378]